MKIIGRWVYTIIGVALAAFILAVDKVGDFLVLAPADKFYLDVVFAILFVGAGVLLDLNMQKLAREIEAERRLRKANEDLKESFAQIRVLRGLLPICAACKKVRDDKGYWQQIEEYIRDHSEADFSHCICPDCAKRLYGDVL